MPWWKSVPRVVAVTAAVVAAAVLAVVLTRPGGGGSAQGGEVFLQSAGSAGQDPYTQSTARQSSPPPASTGSDMPTTGAANEVRGVDGGAAGLYSGTRNAPACDVERQIKYLQADSAKNRSFASVAGVRPSDVPDYLRSLTPVQLRVDTRLTAHGYRDGRATTYQAVLQAGTAVLVDSHGVPRLRCACGNPLTPPVAQHGTPKVTGERWSSYRPSHVVVVNPAPEPVKVFTLYDTRHRDWIHRKSGDHAGRHDEPTKPPADPHPWNHPQPDRSNPSAPSSTGPSTSSSPAAPSSPSSEEPGSSAPGSTPPGNKTSGNETPETRTPESPPGSEAPGPKTPETGERESKQPESRPESPPRSQGPESPPASEEPPAQSSSVPSSAPGALTSTT